MLKGVSRGAEAETGLLSTGWAGLLLFLASLDRKCPPATLTSEGSPLCKGNADGATMLTKAALAICNGALHPC